jgi:hypothetical protein
MLRQLSTVLRRASRGWVALLALAVFLLFSALVLPRQAATAGPAAEEAGSPDLSLYYAPRALYRMAEAYGPDGRQAYIRARFTFDIAWPLVYTFFLVTAISWLASRAFPPASPWQLANLAPLGAALFDLLENLSTSLVMWRYPARTPGVDALAPFFTLAKWTFVGASFLLLLAAALALLLRQRPRAL